MPKVFHGHVKTSQTPSGFWDTFVKKLDERHLGLDSHAPEKEPIVFRKGRGEVAHDAAV